MCQKRARILISQKFEYSLFIWHTLYDNRSLNHQPTKGYFFAQIMTKFTKSLTIKVISISQVVQLDNLRNCTGKLGELMLGFKRNKNRIIIKLATFIIAQVFFVTSLGYTGPTYNKNIAISYIDTKGLRVPMGRAKERIESVLFRKQLDPVSGQSQVWWTTDFNRWPIRVEEDGLAIAFIDADDFSMEFRFIVHCQDLPQLAQFYELINNHKRIREMPFFCASIIGNRRLETLRYMGLCLFVPDKQIKIATDIDLYSEKISSWWDYFWEKYRLFKKEWRGVKNTKMSPESLLAHRTEMFMDGNYVLNELIVRNRDIKITGVFIVIGAPDVFTNKRLNKENEAMVLFAIEHSLPIMFIYRSKYLYGRNWSSEKAEAIKQDLFREVRLIRESLSQIQNSIGIAGVFRSSM